MASYNDNHSGLRGADEALQRQLDTVQAVYFPPELERYSSSDSESESSDDDQSDDLFETSTIVTPCDRANDVDQGMPQNPSDSSAEVEVSDDCIRAFLSASCQCSLGPNERPCSTLFTEATLFEIRSQCLELTSDQLDMLILGRIDGHTKEKVGMKRVRSHYFARGHQLCRKTFLFLHGISKARLSSLKSHLKNNGLTPRVHGNTKCTPHNRTPFTSLKHVVTFIENYANQEGLSLPGRVPGYKNLRIKLLPTSTTKAELWRSYKEAAQIGGYTVVGYTKFVDVWNQFLPFIKIMQPSTDLCHTCQKNTEKIAGRAGASEEDKIAAVQSHQDHLRTAKREREIYNSSVDASKAFLKGHPTISLLSARQPCSLQGTVHYSYDYAQQVHFPTNPQQPGPIYFKTPRKCGIFGVCCESLPRQINYFIDESVATGKGGNATISYVHDFLTKNGAGETNAHFHADNCGGQNKNNYVLWYWCWRVIHGLHESIEYSFLVAGHTKFSPDWCFGLMKQKLRRTFISSLFDIIDANDKSTPVTRVNCSKLVGLHNGTVLVMTYDWANYLAPYFKKLPGISKQHHFRFTKDLPGKVFYRESADSPEKEFQMLKDVNRLPPRVLPPQVKPSGLDEERRRYLHREIRDFCRPGTEHWVAPEVT